MADNDVQELVEEADAQSIGLRHLRNLPDTADLVSRLAAALRRLAADLASARAEAKCPVCDGSGVGEDYGVLDSGGYPRYFPCPCGDGTELGFVRQENKDLRAQLDAATARAAKLAGELENIRDARRFDRKDFDDDTAFADWAQNRARHTLTATPEASANG